jgi:glyoxylase-like metal-dependent hydrolase (beta-lactamase superfamily II)
MSVLSAPFQLSPHLYVLYAEFPHIDSANVYLITGDKPTLIDCGSPRAVPQMARNLELIGMTIADIAQVIVTHGDYDHIQGFHRLQSMNPGLQVYLHPHDWPIVQGNDSYRNASYLYSQPFLPFSDQRFLPIEDGDVLDAGSGQLTVVHTPGHTEGSVSLLGEVDGRAVLFAGDAIGGAMKSLSGAVLHLWAQAALTWQQSLHRLSSLEFEWVLNGHEPVETLPISRTHVDRLVKSFGKMLNPWFTLDEDEPKVSLADDLPPLRPLPTFGSGSQPAPEP